MTARTPSSTSAPAPAPSPQLFSQVPAEIGVCPVCGGRTLAPEGSISALLAVCDVLVFKALETLGKKVVREGRERYRVLGTRPWHEAHTLWQVPEQMVTRSLARAWDVVPALLDTHGPRNITSRQVTEMLDGYVRQIVLAGQYHDVKLLSAHFEAVLGLPVYLLQHERPSGGQHVPAH